MKLGVVSDEIALDFAEAVRHGKSWGIWDYEIRCLKSGRVPDVDEEEIRAVLRTLTRERVRIAALSPGIFKVSLREAERIRHECDHVLPETFRLAERLGTRLIIIFGFARYPDEPGENRERLLELFADVAKRAGEHGFQLAVENEPGHWCDTGRNTAAMLGEVESPHLAANWDLGNAFCSGETPFPDGWREIADLTVNVHVKDYRREGGKCVCVPIGDGEIDYPGQLQAISSEKNLHHVTLETHVEPFLPNSRICAHRLQKMLREV